MKTPTNRKPTHRITLLAKGELSLDNHDVYGGADALNGELIKVLRTQWFHLAAGDTIRIEEV